MVGVGHRKPGLESQEARSREADKRTPGPTVSGITAPDVQHVRSFVRSRDVQQLCLLALCLDPAEDRFLLGLGFDGHPGKCVLGGGGEEMTEWSITCSLPPGVACHAGLGQGPRIVWNIGWGVENSASKCAIRVENPALK